MTPQSGTTQQSGTTPQSAPPTTPPLTDRIAGCLIGAAVGDALGGPVEGYSPEQIVQRHGGRVSGIVGPWNEDWRTARPLAPYHKGDGHITDDTLMTHALIRVYEKVRDHLDAYAVADHLVPDLISTPRWIPELEAEALPLQRIFLAEKWLVTRLHYGHVDPREAGTGNIVNCGAAMYMAPIGLVNAAHPAAAYAEAIEVAGAHQSSYGREAAGVFAAAVAAACLPDATPASVVATCVGLAKDGTRAAIEAVCAVAARHRDTESALRGLREAVAPFDTVGPHYRAPSLGARRPSRLHSIEELPIALGMLLIGAGDYRRTVLGSVNYGRDCDSIATMSGALAGALGGEAAVPAEWARDVAEASRLDLHAPARALTKVAYEVFARDTERRRAHEAAFVELTPSQVTSPHITDARQPAGAR
ncbi:ADP-ribosylglycohydrolase family protein [Streptomyces scopuliridis]|uniref:ADP-ribosylglycohydrolase family protein n=1 Tax=Streptomyces scopuliridis TaxID=452529 RepID=A0ACD4ZQC9_9ACTN|nr:ADP-ribosylglycohydrolase family protein [Streptomyces scopuliridis]WSB36339.1 ADP-ribosylglycohydrolase family protein [Streptomyces scopuliridis]WSC00635.1 ADP-ribosylglycohydrolase family protein [Streptomyces scopuliridis]WSC05754.1 ADP-ribosylglycohydrolase family protein [Streptomyces scopuliridis]